MRSLVAFTLLLAACQRPVAQQPAPVVAAPPAPDLAPQRPAGPSDEQIMRDAQRELRKWRAMGSRFKSTEIVKDPDKFEKDLVSVTVLAHDRHDLVRVFLSYRSADDFWKLTGLNSYVYPHER
jgi:hypothetical protein